MTDNDGFVDGVDQSVALVAIELKKRADEVAPVARLSGVHLASRERA